MTEPKRLAARSLVKSFKANVSCVSYTPELVLHLLLCYKTSSRNRNSQSALLQWRKQGRQTPIF